MDLTTCSDFINDPPWIAKKLKINQLEIEIAIPFLLMVKESLLFISDIMICSS